METLNPATARRSLLKRTVGIVKWYDMKKEYSFSHNNTTEHISVHHTITQPSQYTTRATPDKVPAKTEQSILTLWKDFRWPTLWGLMVGRCKVALTLQTDTRWGGIRLPGKINTSFYLTLAVILCEVT